MANNKMSVIKSARIDFGFGSVHFCKFGSGETQMRTYDGLDAADLNPELTAALTGVLMLLHSLFTAGVDLENNQVTIEIKQAMENIIKQYED